MKDMCVSFTYQRKLKRIRNDEGDKDIEGGGGRGLSMN